MIRDGQPDEAEAATGSLHPAIAQGELHRLCLLAEIEFHRGRDDKAQAHIAEVFRQVPGFPSAHYVLSLIHSENKASEKAFEHAQFAKIADSSEPRHWAQLGHCHVVLGNYPMAEGLLAHAVHADAKDARAWNNLGYVNRAKGKVAKAVRCFERALTLRPGLKEAQLNIEQCRTELEAAGARIVDVLPSEKLRDKPWFGEWTAVQNTFLAGNEEEALRQAEQLCDRWADNADLHCQAASLSVDAGDYPGAKDILDSFLVRHPEDPAALIGLGLTCLAGDESKLAEMYFRKALEVEPESERALNGLASALDKLDLYAECSETLERLLDLHPTPENRRAFAASLVGSCRYEEAIQMFESLDSEPEVQRQSYLPSYTYALLFDGQVDRALSQFNELIERQPNSPNFRTARFVGKLLIEEYASGWDDYLFRTMSSSAGSYRLLPFPRWRGEDLTGKRIVVLAEQGLGDQVMFASCLRDVLALGPAEVVVEVMARVAKTVARSFPECRVIPSSQKSDLKWATSLGEMDYYVPIGDLPAYFRRSRDAFPRQRYLVPDEQRASFWRSQLEKSGLPRPWVGVSWRGGTPRTRSYVRTMAAADIARVRENLPGTLVCLQYGDVAGDLATLPSGSMLYWPESISDLDEFAALVSVLDIVISVCNTTIHYSGALGVPTWILAPKVPEWRYGLRFREMPWYSSAIVVRQPVLGDWQPVIDQATAEARQYWSTLSDKNGR